MFADELEFARRISGLMQLVAEPAWWNDVDLPIGRQPAAAGFEIAVAQEVFPLASGASAAAMLIGPNIAARIAATTRRVTNLMPRIPIDPSIASSL